MANTAQTRTRGETGQNRLGLIVIGLLLGIFVSAMDNTIVSTAMGTIVAQLGGLDQFVWVTSAYMVAELAGMPIIGKLSDMYGRKRFFVFGITVFLAGSVLCGTAHSITQLALFRALQGLGGGALMPVAFTVLFDVVPPEQRGRFSGMFGAVFGTSSIVGPLIGSYITDHLTWRWVFDINVPIGLVALALVVLGYRESPRHVRQVVDWPGACTLVPAVVSLMFALELGGVRYPWHSAPILGLFAAAIVLFALFFIAEAKAEEPIVSYDMFRNRLFAGSVWVGLFSSAAFVVAVVYIPIFVQGVEGGSATNSGLVLLPMMLSSSLAAPVAGTLTSRFRYRTLMYASSAILLAAMCLLATLTTDTPKYWVTVDMILVGLGIGPSFSVLSMAGMHHFDERQRGAASSTQSFIRELGMTVGITVFGMVQRGAFTTELKRLFGGNTGMAAAWAGADPHQMLSPQTRTAIPPAVLDKLTGALASSIAHTFTWGIVLAALALVFVAWLGGEKFQSPGTGAARSLPEGPQAPQREGKQAQADPVQGVSAR
ncbi:MAG: MFS transporter [Alicyclobacillaceae bacterium]|nr:MFS transporter [Alicyclobacillaceae bacterium]